MGGHDCIINNFYNFVTNLLLLSENISTNLSWFRSNGSRDAITTHRLPFVAIFHFPFKTIFLTNVLAAVCWLIRADILESHFFFY